jgi:hypothetical protein
MRNDLALQIVMAHPNIYKVLLDEDGKPLVSIFDFGIGDGWFDIVDVLSHEISNCMRNHPARPHVSPEVFDREYQTRVAAVSERFGMLCFDVENSNREVAALIRMAKTMSSRTCEICGSPGTIKSSNGVRKMVLCRDHRRDPEDDDPEW